MIVSCLSEKFGVQMPCRQHGWYHWKHNTKSSQITGKQVFRVLPSILVSGVISDISEGFWSAESFAPTVFLPSAEDHVSWLQRAANHPAMAESCTGDAVPQLALFSGWGQYYTTSAQIPAANALCVTCVQLLPKWCMKRKEQREKDHSSSSRGVTPGLA